MVISNADISGDRSMKNDKQEDRTLLWSNPSARPGAGTWLGGGCFSRTVLATHLPCFCLEHAKLIYVGRCPLDARITAVLLPLARLMFGSQGALVELPGTPSFDCFGSAFSAFSFWGCWAFFSGLSGACLDLFLAFSACFSF